jgi:hypothetical protein
VPLKIPAPPEAKLTPVIKEEVFCGETERYGGEVGKPTF